MAPSPVPSRRSLDDEPQTSTATAYRLGLVGSGIDMSLSPAFHEHAGRLAGLDVRYDLIPRDATHVPDLGRLLGELAAAGYRGLNITVPFKQLAGRGDAEPTPVVAATGVANTLLLGPDGPTRAFNTDYSGFTWAWRRHFGTDAPGVVALLGAGGVGTATAAALVELGMTGLRVFDLVPERSHTLARSLHQIDAGVEVSVSSSGAAAVAGADGVVNGTPVGMHWNAGAPVDLSTIGQQRWLFDAIYSPIETPLMVRAAATGMARISGFDLFFGQAIDAFEIFTGHHLAAPIVADLESRMLVLERERGV